MIEVLGLKRVIILAVLVILNAGFGYATFMYFDPELAKIDRDMRKEQGRERTIRTDISNIQLEFEQLETQQGVFNMLQDRGFFSNQSRRNAQGVFLDAERLSGVTQAVVNVRPGVVVANEDAAKADHILLQSVVDITVRSVDDVDVMEYITYLKENFPGYLSVEQMSVVRKAGIDNTILRAIATGTNPPLVETKLSLKWTTMVARANYVSNPDGAGG